MKVNRTDFNNSLLDYGFKDYQIKAIQERMDKYIYPQIEAIPLGAEVILPSETLSCELEGRIKETEYWRDIIFSPEQQERKQTISLTDFILRIEELKASKH